MFQQWAFLKCLKRSGCTHDLDGIEATKQGECAILCWACPHDGINLPLRWQEVKECCKFLYVLILTMDTNFCLCHKLQPHKCDDAELGPGWAYFIEPSKYKDHLKDYVSETDVSWSHFQAGSVIYGSVELQCWHMHMSQTRMCSTVGGGGFAERGAVSPIALIISYSTNDHVGLLTWITFSFPPLSLSPLCWSSYHTIFVVNGRSISRTNLHMLPAIWLCLILMRSLAHPLSCTNCNMAYPSGMQVHMIEHVKPWIPFNISQVLVLLTVRASRGTGHW